MSVQSFARLIATLATIAIVPAPAFAALITFEGLANGTVITNQFPGVTFSANAGFENEVSTQPGIGFGANFLCTAPIGGSINCTQETVLDFAAPVNSLQFWQVGDDASGVVARVDVFENFAFSSTVNILGFNDFNTPNLVDLTTFTDVTRIRIHSITDPGGLGWDNFEFDETAPVSEPATLALLAFGLVGARLERRRRQRG